MLDQQRAYSKGKADLLVGRARRVRSRGMLSLEAVKRFSHFPGGFIVRVKCRKCQHERAIPSDFFVRLLGASAAPVSIIPRLRCSKCAARDPIAVADGLPRN